MPAFEGLLSDRKIDSMVQDMLFELAMFYMLAKLAMHTDSTLIAFEAAVTRLGKAMRDFLFKVCPNYDTRELPRETESRKRRRKSSANTKAKRKNFNLNTYKYHRLGDYPRIVRELGTLDGFSTMTVSTMSIIIARGGLRDSDPSQGETEHKRVKRMYARTNKNKNFREQIAHKVQVQRALDRIDRLTPPELKPKKSKKTIKLPSRAREEGQRARVYADPHHGPAPAKTYVPWTPTSGQPRKGGKVASKPSAASREHDRRARIRARIYRDEARISTRNHHDAQHRNGSRPVAQREEISRAQGQTHGAGPQSSVQEPLGPASADDHFQISIDTRNQTTLDDVVLRAGTDHAWKVRSGFALSSWCNR